MPRPLSLFVITVLFATSVVMADEASTPEKPEAKKAADAPRLQCWIDLYQAEPLPYHAVLADLATARVVYLGESHGVVRHHGLQERIVADLAKRNVPLVLGLEQMEAIDQPHLDRYARGEIDFEELANVTDWSHTWSNYTDYRPALEAARKAKAPILALNARATTIRRVARGGGVDKLAPELRKELPEEMKLNDPDYMKYLNLRMPVHMAATRERMRPMFEAQMARDEMMASVLATFLNSEAGKDRTAVVLCGGGHVCFGLGTPDRVRRRMPGVKDRIILMTSSGDVKMTPSMKAVTRPVRVTHDDLRAIGRPIADYLHVTSLKKDN
ncbi:MAG: ChaN family lipoprotein [Pirellulales bacterium]|nr:ChaN family lipoprotein [Pirellulales bacterium]